MNDEAPIRSCGKTRWETLDEAQAALQQIRRHGRRRGKKPVRAYTCENCGGAHLTSRRKEPILPVAEHVSRPVTDWRRKKADEALQRARQMREESIRRQNEQ